MRGKILIFGLKTVRLDDAGSSLRYEEPDFWGKNEPQGFGKVFESCKIYKRLYETYQS